MDAQDLKSAGLKVTLPRLKILEILEKSENHHMSAEDIYRTLVMQGEEVGVATIYRVLTQFEESGMVNKLNFDNGQSVFELSNVDHHDHLVCVKCGKIDEFSDDVIEQHQQAIAKKYGYQLTDHCLYLYGLCKDCQ
ncbi:MAG: ferric iron uptake transcriptional regulator [Candidatus Thioglobus sp.]|jgi:Fur family ferric uptake transcriptional regulator|uniref:ferric iron uptake transcriptional regulator n=1 Tax=Candidatus Thioglobus sp. TaxID=2026721 RepID=UPI0001BD36DD|nr:ferric iron uptake transcriptional regulator [Candidatus Thioglobus sp.]EEZ80187.1 MAG: Fe2+/Zn2+ uptake regulation protein [uncultured Candidatus Thioglobus sp.]MBT3187047.1 ferric iron uptake transcriptional regulator [Candidatus Thioglobus sp.]MBT3431660.1 ferric iron uptake transcriptional regulator [Candidatus Thioglobus sp.]MBT4553662.1 ferric iron uptake transcriptional regulator [Candidatus Thioglobus sp.]MBT4923974.1 ferric iron uptake transcriptional regulator [Candidatus Thioglob